MIMQIKSRCQRQRLMGFKVHENLVLTSCSNGEKFIVLSVRNIPKRRDRANWSRDTVQPMRRRAFVYQSAQNVFSKAEGGGQSIVISFTQFSF